MVARGFAESHPPPGGSIPERSGRSQTAPTAALPLSPIWRWAFGIGHGTSIPPRTGGTLLSPPTILPCRTPGTTRRGGHPTDPGAQTAAAPRETPAVAAKFPLSQIPHSSPFQGKSESSATPRFRPENPSPGAPDDPTIPRKTPCVKGFSFVCSIFRYPHKRITPLWLCGIIPPSKCCIRTTPSWPPCVKGAVRNL